MTILSDVVIVLSPAVAGAIVGGAIAYRAQSASDRRAGRKADRDQARVLFTVVSGAVLQFSAARLDAASAGVGKMYAWDVAEDARFTDGMQAAITQAESALVQLSLLSPLFEAPCGKLAGAIGAACRPRRKADQAKAWEELMAAIFGLRAAVYEFTAPPLRFRFFRRLVSARRRRSSREVAERPA